MSDQKIEVSFIIKVEKLSFWESAVKICDIVGTPTKSIENLRRTFQKLIHHLMKTSKIRGSI